MNNKELFEIALKYITKGYSYEQLGWEDDLYKATSEEKEKCEDYYIEITERGTNWAHQHLKTLENEC